MAIKETVSGMGKNSSRTDKNLSERVARVQRNAKIQNSSNGSYGSRAELQSIAEALEATDTSIYNFQIVLPGSGIKGYTDGSD